MIRSKVLILFVLMIIFSVFLAVLKMYAYNNVFWGPQILNYTIHKFLHVCLWLFIGLVIYRLSIRFPIDKDKWKSSLPLHFAACFVVSALKCYLYYIFQIFLLYVNVNSHYPRIGSIFFTYYRYDLLTYWVILGFSLTFNYYRENLRRKQETADLELKASKLETQLAQAQLQSLKMQLQPHFLFNTLHTISGLIKEDVYSAKKTIALLSDLLRVSLDMTNRQEIRLKEELDFMDKYLEIQKIRFKDRLNIEMNIQPETLDAAVPTLIIQPITENAISHGVLPHAENGFVNISSKLEENNLIIEVHDSGNGIKSKEEVENSNGYGLSVTRERLSLLYPENHMFELGKSPLGGLMVQIRLPFRIF